MNKERKEERLLCAMKEQKQGKGRTQYSKINHQINMRQSWGHRNPRELPLRNFLTLPVLYEIKISHKALVSGNKYRFTSGPSPTQHTLASDICCSWYVCIFPFSVSHSLPVSMGKAPHHSSLLKVEWNDRL